MTRRRSLIAGGAGGIAVLLAGAALADPPAGLAPPGHCAERRIEAREAPLGAFDVAGGPRAHFDPNDVGADGPAEGPGDTFDPPKPPPTFTRGPCEGPSACDTVGGIIESPPVPGNPPPGTTPR